MAKVTYYEPIEMLQGKICSHSDVIFKRFKSSGKNYTSKICNPRDYAKNPLSASEQAAQEKFKQAATTARSEMSDPDKKEAAILRWETTGKKGTLYGFLFREAYAKL